MAVRLGTRIALTQGLLIAAFALAGSFAFLLFAERGLDSEMSARSRAAAGASAAALESLLPGLLAQSPAARALADARMATLATVLDANRIVVLDTEDRVIATSDPKLPHGERYPALALHGFEAREAHAGTASVSEPYSIDGVWFQAAWTPLHDGAIVGVESRVRYRASLERLRRGVLLFAVLGVAVAAGIGYFLARRITDPLAALSRAMEASGPSGLPERAGVRGSDEVGRLGERFDALVETLERHDAELRSLSATVAHEVRNPLGALTGFTDLLERRVEPAETRSLIAGIREEIGVLERLVSRFLSYAGDLRLSRRPSDLGRLLEEAIRVSVPAESSARVERAFVPSGPSLEADDEALREVFVNLIRNAVQASSGGRITVASQERENRVEVSVSDEGPGIADEIRERLFQPFATTKADGTGLGLAISRRIVAAHGGTLTFETAPSGTTFHVRIPRSASTASRQAG